MRRSKEFEPKEVVVVGVDSETQQGPPITIQFHSYDAPTFTAGIQVTGEDVSKKFFKHIERHCLTGIHYRFYGHYLEFDLLSFLWPKREELVKNLGSFEFKIGIWRVVGCYGRPTFARLTTERGHLIEIIDSALWFRGSLDAAAAQYCPDLRKLERPEGLGEKWFSIRDSNFYAYAMRDAEIAARLGALVEQFQRKHSLKPSISLASQAAQIFRLHYVSDPIEQCPAEYIEPAIAAYHGGKNNLVRGQAPAWHIDHGMFDLSSAYPYAMTQLPSFTRKAKYSEVNLPQNSRQVPTPGIYCVTGRLSDCEWPIFYTHDFKPLRNCRVEQLWVHGYELNEALRMGEFKPTRRIRGCYYNDDDLGQSATAKFSRDFYEKKTSAENPIDRYMYKILLNSLSGKFAQTREQEMLDEDGNVIREHVAGGLFQPFIAGAITAHTRAKIHSLEHAFKAIHTATDGIIAPIQKGWRGLAETCGVPQIGLGSLNEEMRGNVVLLRTKLYVGYTKANDDALESKIFKDWRIKKYALHGFQGKVHELEEMIASGRRWYVAPHRIGLREAVKHGTTPNMFIQRQLNLQVGKIRA